MRLRFDEPISTGGSRKTRRIRPLIRGGPGSLHDLAPLVTKLLELPLDIARRSFPLLAPLLLKVVC